MAPRLLSSLLIAALTACSATPEAPAREVVYQAQTYIAADYETVWQAIVDGDQHADWFTAPAHLFNAERGAALRWATPEREVYSGEMLHVERGRGVAWSMRFMGFGFSEPSTELQILVQDRGPVVQVLVRHAFPGAPQSAALVERGGWDKVLARLKTYAETGSPMPWPEEEG